MNYTIIWFIDHTEWRWDTNVMKKAKLRVKLSTVPSARTLRFLKNTTKLGNFSLRYDFFASIVT